MDSLLDALRSPWWALGAILAVFAIAWIALEALVWILSHSD